MHSATGKLPLASELLPWLKSVSRNCLGLLEIAMSRCLAWVQIAGRRGAPNPYRAIALKPKLAFLVRNAAPVNGAIRGVSLEENQAF